MAMKSVALATMQAVRMHRYGGPEVLVLEEIPRPEPASDEVLIKVRATSVNPWDHKVRSGQFKGRLPMILGWDVAGTIAAAGKDATGFREGDEIFGLLNGSREGAYAEYVASKPRNLARKPRSLDFVEAASMPTAALAAWQSLFDLADLKAGQTVLIHGAAGGVGHFAVQFAKWKGAGVIGTATGPDTDFVRGLGAVEVIDYQKNRFEDLVRNVDVVLDVIGGDTQNRSWRVLKKGGVLVTSVGLVDHDAPERYGVLGKMLSTRPNGEELAKIGELVDDYHVKPVVNTVFPLKEAALAHALVESGKVRGKVVLKVGE